MKKLTTFFALILTLSTFTSFAQDTDFYAGKWEILVEGTPNGDIKFETVLVRKDGKLSGELKLIGGEAAEPIPLTNVEEVDGKLTLYFTTQGYDINCEYEKVDNDNLKGKMMNMFDTKAVRKKD